MKMTMTQIIIACVCHETTFRVETASITSYNPTQIDPLPNIELKDKLTPSPNVELLT